MRRGRVLLVLAGLIVPSCGPSEPPAQAPQADVQGTAFRVAKPEPLPPETASIGDLDGAAPPGPPLTAPAPSSAARTATVAAAPAAPRAQDDFEASSFDELAGFECAEYGSSQKREIPAAILALSGRRLVIDGYMMPLQYEAGGAKKFLLMRYKFGCCYAVSPRINEWIEVTMDQGVADYLPDTITSVWGVLAVHEEMREGAPVGLYKMKASRTEFSEAK